MKILYISDRNYIHVMSLVGDRHYMDYWNYLISNTESMSIWCNDPIDREGILKFAPDIVLAFHCNEVSYLLINVLEFCNTLKVPVALLLDDFFYPKILQKSRTDLVHAILFKCRQEETRLYYQKLFPDKFIGYLDHYINTKVFHSQNVEKEYDILVYGSRHHLHDTNSSLFPLTNVHEEYLRKWKERNNVDVLPAQLNFYEFRKRVTDLILSLGDEYRIKVLEPKGNFNAQIKNEELSVEIGKSYLSLCTKTCIDKCMMKYIETAASDTVILGDIPTDYRDILEENTIEIHEDMSDERILETIRNALDNKKRLLYMGRDFGKKIREIYGGDYLYKYTVNILDKIIKWYKLSRNRMITMSIGEPHEETSLTGGLGNQLFGLFTLYSLCKEYNATPVLQFTDNRKQRDDDYRETLFKNFPFTTINNIGTYRDIVEYNHNDISPGEIENVFRSNNKIRMVGYFQNPDYFNKYRGEIKNMLYVSPKDELFIDMCINGLRKHNRGLIGVHCRRGDYTQLRWELPVSYFRDAMNTFGEDNVFLFFSDDIQWCKDNFPGHQYSDSKNYIELLMMSRLDGLIISNSTYSWWAAYLGGMKRVVCPYPWIKNHKYNEGLYRTGWTRINW